MIDSFPWESWLNRAGDAVNKDISTFWTFGPGAEGGRTGTYVLTVLGIILMVAALVGWVMLENRKLKAQTEALRAAGAIPVPAGPQAAGASQPPLAGPTTDPGD